MLRRSTPRTVSLGLAAALAIFSASAHAQQQQGGHNEAGLQPASEPVSMDDFNACKREAYDYGVMGTFRRLFILSCVETDVTASIGQAALD